MKFLFFTILLFPGSGFFAQSTQKIEELIASDRTQVDKIKVLENPTTTLISSEFSEGKLGFKPINLDDLTIVKIYYVYTKYKLNPDFDQKKLDTKRFELFDKNYPGLVTNPLIEWELIEQTGCADFRVGTTFFHGFILVHRPSSNSNEREKEIEKLMSFLENPVDTFAVQKLDFVSEQLPTAEKTEVEDLIPEQPASYREGEFALYQYFQNKIYTPEIGTKRDDIWVEVSFDVDAFGRIGIINFKDDKYPDYVEDKVSETIRTMPEWNTARKNGNAVNSTVNLSIRVSYSRSVNGIYLRDGEKPSFEGDEEKIALLDKSNVVEKGDRLRNSIKYTGVYRGMELIEREAKLAMVVDVTGSMSQHIAVLKRWIQLNQDTLPFTSYSFFNDGDNKPTSQKKKGKTGGIYMTKDVNETSNTIVTAMKAGNGGEVSESDMEAVLFAIENDSLCDEILLVADNYSDVRDISLLGDIHKKVNVLLCEAPQTLRVEYLKIIKDTGGYLLLNGEKINLNHLKKGDNITIQDNTYNYDGTDFRLRKE